MRHSLLSTTTFLSFALLPGLAASQETPIMLDMIYLDAGLSPLEAQAYGRAHSVVTRDEIEARGVRSVQDALRGLPGLAVSSSGASNTQLRIRGAEANHTLILIDGVRASAGDEEYFLSGLDTANIERIEVLRGPQSVFFGADASAGVVNIVTREAEQGVSAGGTVEIGNGWAASLHASRRDDRGGLSFTAMKRDDEGYDHSGDQGDKDGIRRNQLQFSFDRQLTDTIRAGIMLRRADEEYDYDASSWTATTADDYIIDSNDFAERHETAGRIWAEAETAEGRMLHRLSYDQTRFALRQNGGTADKARTEFLRYRAIYGIDGAHDTASQTLAFGLERREDENSLASNENRSSNSIIAEYRGAYDNGLDVQLGLRHDANDVFDDATTWSLGLSWQLPNAPLRLHASAGTGVVNPRYGELFGEYGSVGNPNLQPEENRGFDLGVEATILDGRGTVDLTYFHEDLESEITYVCVPTADPYTCGTLSNGTNYENQSGTSQRRGVEIAAKMQVNDAFRLGGSYTYLDASDPGGSREIRRPRHTLGLNAEYLFAQGRGSISGDVTHVAANADSQFFGSYVTKDLPDYTVVNVAAGYDLTDRVRLTGRVTNLLDEEYSEVWGYSAPGREAYLGLSARW
ncbi:TonB-dependent receptor plug domain-containing protein [Paracoccus sediminicola]|uniref:TonB-dependent receptor plug domain-containing protein n=1 Tax=Paracoccus sediminicola TaxID=3017783 RepID=UPI0022F0DFD2|nr:TonB-dependent receptor [Paracoccus sediminicola]WBU56688.1 TonB-dependent receptor [Paracoccus sediminicola]